MIWFEEGGANAALYLRIVSTYPKLLKENNSKDSEMYIGNKVYEDIKNRLDFRGCLVCFSGLRLVHENNTNRVTGFIFWTNLRVESTCPSPNMKYQFDKLNGKLVHLIFNETEEIFLDVSYENRPYSDVLTESEEVIGQFGFCNQGGVLTLDRRLRTDFRFRGDTCAQIKLVYGEIEALTTRNERIRFASFFGSAETPENTTSVKVCVDDYMLRNSGARVFKIQDYFVVIVSCIFVLYFLHFRYIEHKRSYI